MAKQEIREPRQKRSLEKKQSILTASYRLFCAKGYYKTNTAEIAQEAEVSTGIVYSYFHDKKDILLEVIKFYIASLQEQFQPLLTTPIRKENLPVLVEQFLNLSIASHTMNVAAHNEFLALSLLEKDIRPLFDDFENTVTSSLCELLVAAGFSGDHLLEKVRICYGLMEQVCHDSIQREQSQEELDINKLLTVRVVTNILTDSL
jgi:AcrR family transcriptional regulator